MDISILYIVIGFAFGLLIATGFMIWFMRSKLDDLTSRFQATIDNQQQAITKLESEKETLGDLKGKLERDLAQYEGSSTERIQQLESLQEKVKELEREKEDVNRSLSGAKQDLVEARTQLDAERNQTEEKLKLLEDSEKRLKEQFENIANKLFEDKGKRFTEQNKEQIGTLLSPLKTQLDGFRKKVEETYDKESKERVSLLNEVQNLQKASKQIGEDATNLTNALKGESKTRGTWGEFILETVLDSSGLRKGHEYQAQGSFRDEEGKLLRPDIIVFLPEEKAIVIDSKLSLLDYERYFNAETDKERESYAKGFLSSLRGHIGDLASKSYDDLPDKRNLDFVLMFIPIEGAFHLAVELDRGLFDEAMAKRIGIVSPSTLLPSLRLVNQIWRSEQHNQHAKQIAKRAGDLYDKLVGFVGSFEKVGRHLKTAQDTYDKASGQLSTGKGNLISKAESMKALGIDARKSLPSSIMEQGELSVDSDEDEKSKAG